MCAMQLSFYDLSRGALKCELVGRAVIRGTLGTPTCLSPGGGEGGSLFWGDTAGAVSLLSAAVDLPAKQLTHESSGDFQLIHKEHNDWVTQVFHILTLVYIRMCTCSP